MEEDFQKFFRPFNLSSVKPTVSVITATYNAENYLADCIESVLNQSYKNYEYIIIDGGSNDHTLNIIKKHQHSLAYWISEPDKGIYDAWNKGLAKAKGDWIVFIGADDILQPDALQIYINHIIQHPKNSALQFVSSQIQLVNKDLIPIRVVGEPWCWERFKKEMITWHVGTFHSKLLFSQYGNFDNSFKISGDYELLLRPKDKLVTSFISQITAKMRVGGVSSHLLIKASKETYQAKIKNGVMSNTKGQFLILVDKLRLLVRNAFS